MKSLRCEVVSGDAQTHDFGQPAHATVVAGKLPAIKQQRQLLFERPLIRLGLIDHSTWNSALLTALSGVRDS